MLNANTPNKEVLPVWSVMMLTGCSHHIGRRQNNSFRRPLVQTRMVS
jgi:outer membrane biogenesis lipoprotein LolB